MGSTTKVYSTLRGSSALAGGGAALRALANATKGAKFGHRQVVAERGEQRFEQLAGTRIGGRRLGAAQLVERADHSHPLGAQSAMAGPDDAQSVADSTSSDESVASVELNPGVLQQSRADVVKDRAASTGIDMKSVPTGGGSVSSFLATRRPAELLVDDNKLSLALSVYSSSVG